MFRQFLAASAMALCANAVFAQGAVIAIQLEPPHLDPTSAAAGAIDEVLYANVFEGLTRFAADGSVVPGLAASWDVSEDGTVYTFHLREGVTFHDGSSFDAEDVKFSLDRARAEGSTNAQKGLFAGITDVTVVDAKTVQVTLNAPNGAFPFNMAWGDAVIVAPESIEGIKQKPIGTGAFRFTQWVQGDRLEMEKNPDYWGEPAKLDGVTFRFISDPSAAFAAVMAEDIDAFRGYPAPENLSLFEADPRFQVLVGSTEGEAVLAINHRKAPLNDLRVRQAISHAIDRQALIDGAMFGIGTPIGSFFAPHNPAYVDQTAKSAYDPEKAKALLAEAGVTDLSLVLKLPPPAYARRGGELIASQLRSVGITTSIEAQEWPQWLETTFGGAHDYDLTIVAHTEPMDIGIFANPEYYFGYDSKAFQELYAKFSATADQAERSAMLGQLQEILADDAAAGFLFQLPVPTVAKANLKGLWPNAPTQATDMTAVYWE